MKNTIYLIKCEASNQYYNGKSLDGEVITDKHFGSIFDAMQFISYDNALEVISNACVSFLTIIQTYED
jgi:hypothetical protein